MKAIILAGGIGIRLRPFTFSIPKPLMPIGESPILEIIIKGLKKAGFGEFILAVGYKSKMVEAYFGDGSQLGVDIRYLREKESSGTAGPLAEAREKFNFSEDESLLLMNGDILTKLDFNKMIDFHKKNALEITVGVKNIKERKAYGIIDIKDRRVRAITEKPFNTQAISAGIYIINAGVLQEVPDNGFFTMPNLINKLLSKNRPIGAYNIKEYWLGLESLRHFEDIYNSKHIWQKIVKS